MDYQTKTYTNSQAVIGVIALLVMVTVFNIVLYLQPVHASLAISPDERLLVALTNQERAKAGLTALQANAQLTEAARAKADDMLLKGYFDHTSPVGRTPWVFIKAAGYGYTRAGENLAIDFPTIAGPINGWLASPPHRANLLKPDYTEIGLAEVKGHFQGRETTIVVQLFATPAFSLTHLLAR